MGKKAFLQVEEQVLVMDDPKPCYDGKGSFLRPSDEYPTKEDYMKKAKCADPCEHKKEAEKEAAEKKEEAEKKEKQLEIIEHKKAADKLIKEQEKKEEAAFKNAIEGDEELKKEVMGKASGKVGTKGAKKEEE